MNLDTCTFQNFLDGQILLLNKPIGWSSFDVVKKIRNLILKRYNQNKIKIGHAGTLDPLASGLLLICTGRYTKKITELQEKPKTYTGSLMLGATTPSYDLETKIDSTYSISHINKKRDVYSSAKEISRQYMIPQELLAKTLQQMKQLNYIRKKI